MRRSLRVQNAIDAGWSAVGDFMALSWSSFTWDPRQGEYDNLTIRAGEREVQVSVSPTGRSVRVFVDGVEAKPPSTAPAG